MVWSLEGVPFRRPPRNPSGPRREGTVARYRVSMATLARLTQVPVTELKGVGAVKAGMLSRAGIETVADLLHHIPHRYVDRSLKAAIGEAPIGEELTLVGEVREVRDWQTRRGNRSLHIVEATIGDDTGQIRARWFNQRFRLDQLEVGSVVVLSGQVESFRGARQMKVPDLQVFGRAGDSLNTGRVVPVHSVVGDIGRGEIRRWIHSALGRSQPIPDPVPTEFLAAHGLMERDRAYHCIHFPDTMEDTAEARRRLAYDELFRLELALAMAKARRITESDGIPHSVNGALSGKLLDALPFRLTGAQQRVLDEIRSDLASADPMHRLLQGEVGSGKTVVAVAALLEGVEGGWQTAIMAPTEVLAEQHFLAVARLLAGAGLSPDTFGAGAARSGSLFESDGPTVRLALLTGSNAVTNYDGKLRRPELLEDIEEGRVDLVVGTHALIQEGVGFQRLGIAVVDEQHRFGVEQRREIRLKAGTLEPDLLIMTATPIPRTLTMTLYGDLEVSVIDEMPPGRTPVATTLISREREVEAWDRIRAAVAQGRQGFVVCPLVEDSEKVEAASATAEHQRLSQVFPDLAVGLIHGQMRPTEKEAVMSAFRDGQVDVLVSTTVIEVGIDVPNATVMVIEDAGRFGLSQLHQLRGRVGRGEHPGECVLLAEPGSEDSEQRLAAMVATNDGFVLAEEDLRIRGYGTVFGDRQSGMKDLRIADIFSDFELLKIAQRDAFGLVGADPGLERHQDLAEEVRAVLADRVDWLFRS
jgi:ATP-dependent DNA helicase RecG